MKNEERIKKFMSEIDPAWGNLKKARYICNNLCNEMYSYDPEFNYGDQDFKGDVLNRIIQIIYSGNEEELKKMIENEHQICIGMAVIYARLLKQAGLQDVEQLAGDVFFRVRDGKNTCVNIVKELYRVKMKERPEGFGSDLLEEIEQIDKELGFIDENGYKDNENYNVSSILSGESNFESMLQRVLDDRGEYISTVIGGNLKNVEFHKYYKYLLKTAFPDNKILIHPLDKKYMEGIQYALIARTNQEGNRNLYYLYDKEQARFVQVTEQDIIDKQSKKKLDKEEGISHCML